MAQSRARSGTAKSTGTAKSSGAARSGGTSRGTGAAKSKANSPSADTLLKYYGDMLLIRRFEEKAGQLYGMGLIGGFCHLYIGQEAVVVGIQSHCTERDQVTTTYRDHGHMLAVGMDPKGVMAELTGREGGYSRGKGGSMHMFSRETQFYGGHGIVGANVPLGAGLAFANRYLETGTVSVTYFGDGAANQGQVYETFNMAALWHLPALFVIENNQYAMGTSQQRSTSTPELYTRGGGLRHPGRAGRRHGRAQGRGGGGQARSSTAAPARAPTSSRC